MQLSARIRIARQRARLSQEALARQLGISRGAVANWECSVGALPATSRLEQLARITAVRFEWLATGRGMIVSGVQETPALVGTQITVDQAEDRLLMAFRRIPSRKRESLVRWLEEFF